jgi:hypothetical protein
MRQIGDRDLELAALLHNGIDARFDQAATGGLVRRGFDLGLGGKGDRKALVRIFVFPPAAARKMSWPKRKARPALASLKATMSAIVRIFVPLAQSRR